jgi:hypothetical protein
LFLDVDPSGEVVRRQQYAGREYIDWIFLVVFFLLDFSLPSPTLPQA